MALWGHGVDHGIVVNIGQGQTVALPVVKGEATSWLIMWLFPKSEVLFVGVLIVRPPPDFWKLPCSLGVCFEGCASETMYGPGGARFDRSPLLLQRDSGVFLFEWLSQ